MTQRWTAPAAPANIARLRNAVGAFAQEAGLSRERAADVRLAVSEALTNAVVHAYREGAEGELEVSARKQARRLEVTVQDRGVGVRPRPDSPGMGMGLPMIAALATESDISARQGGGTVVTMHFALA
jgi:serine/threonine-protein kinase RsbW/stage II sporulation protein AB (anti-sigma F factor)